MQEVDLHGLRPEDALRRLAQALHAARVRGASQLLVITGRGLGNLDWKPVLRPKVEAWLGSGEGKRLGVRAWRVIHKGGALEVQLEGSGSPPSAGR